MGSLKHIGVVLMVLLAVASAGPAFAGAVLTLPISGVQIGVNDQGHLNFGSPVRGIFLPGVGDGISPGCLCEGWGVAGNGIAGWASIDDGGIVNISLDSFVSTATTATSVTHMTSLSGLVITHAFAPSTSTALFAVTVTIANTTGSTITNVRYSRSMDWDIPPTTFNEFVTIGGLPAANLVYSNDNGFATPNPLVNPPALLGGTTNVNFTDSGPSDHGAFFTFAFGDLAAGASKTFNIFYGADRSESLAFTALTTVGAEVFSFGQSNGGQITGAPGTYIFGFKGVGGQPIGGGCPPHRVHGHISTVPPTHSGTSHEHHGVHGHTVAPNCPPHAPGHTPGGAAPVGRAPTGAPSPNPMNTGSPLLPDPGEGLFSTARVADELQFVAAVSSDGAKAPLRRGTVVQLFGSARGLYFGGETEWSATEVTPPLSGNPLYHTSSLPLVRLGNVEARVLFSGLAPGLTGVWQINLEIPEDAPTGSVPVTIFYEGQEIRSIDLTIE